MTTRGHNAAMNDAVLIADNSRGKTARGSLFSLVVVHSLVAVALGLNALVPMEFQNRLFYALVSPIPVAQVILLSFWIGLASSRPFRHLPIALLGVAYVHAWAVVAHSAIAGESTPEAAWLLIAAYLRGLAMYLAFFLVQALAFALVRWRLGRLRRLAAVNRLASARPQFSIFQLMLLTLIVAVILGLVLFLWSNTDSGSSWAVVATFGLIYFLYLVNALCAVWAALGPRWIGLRIVLAFLVAALLGFCLTIMSGSVALFWWFGALQILEMMIPTAIVVASLLVVRSCGYRLVSRQQPVAEVPA